VGERGGGNFLANAFNSSKSAELNSFPARRKAVGKDNHHFFSGRREGEDQGMAAFRRESKEEKDFQQDLWQERVLERLKNTEVLT